MRFCGACGTELAPAAAPRQVRKTVTIVFCDVTGSTALGERLDPEALRRTMGRYFEEIRAVVERHGGLVEKFIGDAVMAVFGIPTAHEDDAVRAVRAVAEIRERLQALGEELAVSLSFRTGVNTGEVVAGEGETLVTGDAVNVAARLEQAAAAGEILIGAETYRLVRERRHGRGGRAARAEGESASRCPPTGSWPSIRSRRAPPATSTCPSSGGCASRARLLDDFEDVVSGAVLPPVHAARSGRRGQVAARRSSSSPTSPDEPKCWSSRCLHYGDDITYWPLVEMLIPMGVEPDAVIGASPAETQLAFRRLLEERATLRASDLAPRRPALGRGRCSSTSSSTSPTGRATPRSCCSASPGRSCSRRVRVGAAASSTPPRSCSSRSRPRTATRLIARLAAGADAL